MCPPMICRIITKQITEQIHGLLESHTQFPEELKGGHKGTKEKGNLLYFDQLILKESKATLKNVD